MSTGTHTDAASILTVSLLMESSELRTALLSSEPRHLRGQKPWPKSYCPPGIKVPLLEQPEDERLKFREGKSFSESHTARKWQG